MKKVEEMGREELVQELEEYGKSLDDLGDGYIPISILREEVASLRPQVIEASSEFGFVEQEEAEELDADAEEQYEWYTIKGSSAKRRRKIK